MFMAVHFDICMLSKYFF